MHQESGELVLVPLKPEKHSESNVINSSLLRPVMSLRVICVIMFRPGRVQFLVTLPVVRLLKQNVRPNPGFLEPAEILDGCRGNVDVHAADVSVLVVDAVDCRYAVEDVLNRIVDRVFSCFDCEAFVSHVLQCYDLGADFVLSELLAGNGLVLGVVRAVETAVDAVVRQVQRREKHNPVAVESLLDFFGD